MRTSAAPAAAPATAVAPYGPYHTGERQAQQMAGVLHQADAVAAFVRTAMTEQHRAFWPLLPLFYVGTVAADGRPWASALAGPPGFVSAPNTRTLQMSTKPAFGDPINLVPGTPVGGLGLEQHTRRRNRVNGHVNSWDAAAGQLTVRVDQAFGNCPKYITSRHLVVDEVAMAETGQPRPVQHGEGSLDQAQREFISAATTFFIATQACDAAAPASARGCDMSHRGGPPGFVHIAADGRSIAWPDYAGNNMFQTLGNLALNPRAGLLFIDFDTGDTLQITGEAEVSQDTQDMPGAQRSVVFHVHSWVQISGALPIRAIGPVELSPYNPQPAAASSAVPVQCVAVRQEAVGIKTFEFRAPRGLRYRPGMYTSFDLQVDPSSREVINRTWTVSSHPKETAVSGTFTITVKRAGLASSWLHDHMRPGRSLQLRGIQGDFVPQHPCRPVLLVAAGIGITPMRVMFLEALKRRNSAVLVYSVRTPAEAAFLGEMTAAAEAAGPQLARLVVSVTGAGQLQQSVPTSSGNDGGAGGSGNSRTGSGGPTSDSKAVSWQSARLTRAALAAAVPDAAARDLYVCGPGGFMDAVISAAHGLGVAPDRVYQESFTF